MTDYFKYQQKIECKDTGEICFGYIEYLNSQHWKNLRSKLIGVYRVCAKCGKQTSNIQLHHLTYKRLGREKDSDLLPLCDSCHKGEHRKSKNNRNSTHKNIKNNKKRKNLKKSNKKKSRSSHCSCASCGFYSYDRKIHQPYCTYTCDHISSNKKGCKNYSPVGYITKYSKKTCSV